MVCNLVCPTIERLKYAQGEGELGSTLVVMSISEASDV